ncbi:hypothetical protein [Paenibacillus urinalis]
MSDVLISSDSLAWRARWGLIWKWKDGCGWPGGLYKRMFVRSFLDGAMYV